VRRSEGELGFKPPPTLFAASELAGEDFVIQFLLVTPAHQAIALNWGENFDSLHEMNGGSEPPKRY
jgi:hypothetical protein